MIRVFKICAVIPIAAILSLGFISPNEPSAYEIVKNMFTATRQIRTLTYTTKKTERINGAMVVQTSNVKINRKPYKVYTKQTHPKAGLEVLYVEGANNNKALINTNSFPWMNLSLDPYGSIMRDKQHHTIKDAGYDYFISILEYLFNKYSTQTASMLTKDTLTWNGYRCWEISFKNPNFKFIDYKLQPGENLQTVAEKYKISSYMIMEKNKGIDDHCDVSAGQVIKIPNDYAPRLTIYVDKTRKIPLLIKVYDEKGLFEQYEYTNVILNPNLKPEEFTADYSEYGF